MPVVRAAPTPAKAAPVAAPARTTPVTPTAQFSSGTGSPIPATTRNRLEASFGANLSGVRVHTGPGAAAMAGNLRARAFAYGPQIVLGAGQRADDLPLMAHEVTHVLQQGAAPTARDTSPPRQGPLRLASLPAVALGRTPPEQSPPLLQRWTPFAADRYEAEANRAADAVSRGESFAVSERTAGPRAQRFGLGDILDYFADKANAIPGFRMFTFVLGVNPINMSRVERSGANFLRAVIGFIPGGELIIRALDQYGVFDRVGKWLEEQVATLGMTGAVIRDAILEFIDSLGWRDIFHPGDVWDRAKRIFTDPIDRIINFVKGLVSGIIKFIKEAILRPLAKLAEGTRGYDLLKAVLGEDPVTGDPVPRTADTLIGGFMKLIGQEEVWNNIKRANAIPRAWAWFQGALAGLLGFVRQIPGLFLAALRSLELVDIVVLPRAFLKVASAFGNFIGRFLSWAGEQVLSLLQIIFEVVAPSVMPYIRKAAAAFRTIVQDPIRFIRNLVRAGIQGFRQFADHFLAHLRKSLIEWLTGTMSGASIYIPQAFTLKEIIKFVLSVLGLTWQNIRQKLVRVIGEPAVVALETAFDIVVTLVREGPAAAWEKIQESISNLRDLVMEQVMTFVRDRVVQAAITKLITSLNPAGAFIQAIIAIYNTIMFFVERLKQIARVAMAFIDSIAAIAAGSIGAAANKVEQTMAGLLTLVISFLARIAGLGKVSDAVTNIINRVRQPIDRALDRVVAWIVEQAKKLGKLVAGAARGAAARVLGWWRTRQTFRDASGQTHALYFTGEGRGARLTLASSPRSFEDVLNDQSLPITNRDALLARLNAINQKIAARAENLGDEQQQNAFQAEIERDVAALAADLSRWLQQDTSLPTSVVTWGASAGRAASVRAEPLTRNPGNTTGSAATGDRSHAVGYALVSRWDQPTTHARFEGTVSVNKSRVTAAHLLHHELHGPYTAPWNIALADQGLNNRMANYESNVVAALRQGKQLRYTVSVAYFSNQAPPADAMTAVDVSPDTAQSWVDFYIASQAVVAALAWENGSYSRQVAAGTAAGERTPVRGRPAPPMRDRVLAALREKLTGEVREEGGRKYTATTVTVADDLARIVGRNTGVVRAAVQELLADRTIIKPNPRGPFYVRQ